MSKLEFEKPILELEGKISELRNVSSNDSSVNIAEEISRMENKVSRLLKQTYSKLTPTQKVMVARHNNRPHFQDYIAQITEDFIPLSGDRNFADDFALMGGLARINGYSCVIMGHEKGHDTETRLKHNFGMARPEGYRKAQRLMLMAEQYGLPIITLVDTAGAYPGVGAEERGQAEAIAKSIETCLRVKTPIISVIIGEGGSGGAIAIATADRVLMLEHSIYSVISPEGCASILWRSAEHADDAANALKLTAQDLLELKLIDGIISEPIGGAHRHKEDTIKAVGRHISKAIEDLSVIDGETLLAKRHDKYLKMGRQ
jgi:acetyl-CoA carboxylase carboxyl transferase subunit alpha